MEKLWSKSKTNKTTLSTLAEKFTVGNDHELDEVLLPYDIEASIAHAKGLHEINVLTDDELKQIKECLCQLKKSHKQGKFKIDQAQEDCHTAIEQHLIAELGELGKKIHLGRSRNDQVLTALRMYEKEQLWEILNDTYELAKAFIDFAKSNQDVPMSGYTHTQPAMLASVGMWAGQFAEMLNSNGNLLKSLRDMINHCPLGTAAGFGVNVNLKRESVSNLLRFKSPITVAMTAQSTRGKWEASVVHGLSCISATLAQFASDLILYTSKEYEYFEVADELTTGSSIMPQKRNQDVAEIIRAKHVQILNDQIFLQQLTLRLTSGYHRDLQLSKEPTIRALQDCKASIGATLALVKNLKVKKENLIAGIHPEIFATSEANKAVFSGMSFRAAYQLLGKQLETLEVPDLEESLKENVHLGATGNLGLEIVEENINHNLLEHEVMSYRVSLCER